jgi:hypothetical protein
MKNNFNITDNFLTEKEFRVHRDQLFDFEFPWSFNSTVVNGNEDPAKTPGGLLHLIYMPFRTPSPFYPIIIPTIIKKLNATALWRVQANLLLRLPEPFYHQFHSDTVYDMEEDVASQWTISILYMNNNNGYTELEDGTKIESVENRLVSFPSNIRHRVVTQTDEQRRVVMNMVYLKGRKPPKPKSPFSISFENSSKNDNDKRVTIGG